MRYRIAFWTAWMAVLLIAFYRSADAGVALIVGAVLGVIGLWIDDETRGDRVLGPPGPRAADPLGTRRQATSRAAARAITADDFKDSRDRSSEVRAPGS